jgi:hypothetical protein
MTKERESSGENEIDEARFKEAVRRLLDTPPQHKSAKTAKGGKTRVRKLSKPERVDSAKKAARARWQKERA